MQDYLKAVDSLTVNNSKLKLETEIKQLSEKSKEDEYIIRGKLQEREHELSILTKHDSINTETITYLVDEITRIREDMKMLKQRQLESSNCQ